MSEAWVLFSTMQLHTSQISLGSFLAMPFSSLPGADAKPVSSSHSDWYSQQEANAKKASAKPPMERSPGWDTKKAAGDKLSPGIEAYPYLLVESHSRDGQWRYCRAVLLKLLYWRLTN
eukprot:2536047-Amphidinium_carterae.1